MSARRSAAGLPYRKASIDARKSASAAAEAEKKRIQDQKMAQVDYQLQKLWQERSDLMSLIDQETKGMSETTPEYMLSEFDVLIEDSTKSHPSTSHRVVGESAMKFLPSPHDVAHFESIGPERQRTEILRFQNMIAAKSAELAGLNAMNDELWDCFRSGKHVEDLDAEHSLRAPGASATDTTASLLSSGRSTIPAAAASSSSSSPVLAPRPAGPSSDAASISQGEASVERSSLGDVSSATNSVDPRLALLQSIPTFQHLSDMDLSDMLVHCTEETFTKNQTIAAQHTAVKSVSVVMSGSVRVMVSRIAKRKKWALEGLLERVKEQKAKDDAKAAAKASRREARRSERRAAKVVARKTAKEAAKEGGDADDEEPSTVPDQDEEVSDVSDHESDDEDEEDEEPDDDKLIDDEIIGMQDEIDEGPKVSAKERWEFLRKETQRVTSRTHTLGQSDMFGTHGMVSPAAYVADTDTVVLLHLPLWAYGRILSDADGMAAIDVSEEVLGRAEVKQLVTHMQQYTVLSTQLELNRGKGSTAENLMIKLMAAFAPELNHTDIIERTMHHVRKHFGAVSALLFSVDLPNVELTSSKRARGLKRLCTGAFDKCVSSGRIVDIANGRADRSWDSKVCEEAGVKGYKRVLLVPVTRNYKVTDIFALIMPAPIRAPPMPPPSLAGTASSTVSPPLPPPKPPTPSTPQEDPIKDAGKELLMRVSALLGNLRGEDEKDTADSTFIRISEMTEPFCLSIRTAEFAHSASSVWCSVKLYHGSVCLSDEMKSSPVSAEPVPDKFLDDAKDDSLATGEQFRTAVFNCTLHTPSSSFAHLPRATRVIFQLYAENDTKANPDAKPEAIGWVGCELFGFDHALRTGRHDLKLWPGACPDVISLTALENTESLDPDQNQLLKIQFLAMPKPVLHRMEKIPEDLIQAAREGGEHSGEAASASEVESGGDTLEWVTQKLQRTERKTFMRIVQDPVSALSAADKTLLWRLRLLLKPYPFLLGPVLRSADWMNPLQAAEAVLIIYEWGTPHHHEALALLTAELPDPRIRSFAIQCLESIDDNEMQLYLLQLVQTLKFEHFHDSALARFLLRRAIHSPTTIGHSLFWLLKAEMHLPLVRERFGLLLNLYLKNINVTEKRSLGSQMLIMNRLSQLAVQIQDLKETSSAKESRKIFLKGLKTLPLPRLFQLPSSPGILCTGIIPSKCRVINSTNKPLLLVFTTVDKAKDGRPTAPLQVIFKKGDDVRQDQLILQLLGLMGSLWKEENLDLCLSPYRCVATGWCEGMLEVVPNSMTLEEIVRRNVELHKHADAEASDSAGPVSPAVSRGDQSLLEWLRARNEQLVDGKSRPGKSMLVKSTSDAVTSDGAAQHAGVMLDPETSQPAEFYRVEVAGLDAARRRFMLSLAGYCVMSCVLGLGNRHFGNIMLRGSGEVFHIDFDLFLGKMGAGAADDGASTAEGGAVPSGEANDAAAGVLSKPFHMARTFLAVLGGRNGDFYREFELVACEALNILRKKKNATMIMGLLSLMTASDLEELKSEGDLKYVKDQLSLAKDDDEVTVEFRRFIGAGATS